MLATGTLVDRKSTSLMQEALSKPAISHKFVRSLGDIPGLEMPIATRRLSVEARGRVVYCYKRPFRDGSTHVVLEPLDFLARLAALVPRPRLNLSRFHEVFAPDFKHRSKIVPQRPRGRVDSDQPLAPMSWAQRLKRVFAIEIEGSPGRVQWFWWQGMG